MRMRTKFTFQFKKKESVTPESTPPQNTHMWLKQLSSTVFCSAPLPPSCPPHFLLIICLPQQQPTSMASAHSVTRCWQPPMVWSLRHTPSKNFF